MGVAFSGISDRHKAFIEQQDLFFVATAPSALDERVNVSPKGYTGLKVFDPNHVGYLDLTGSGNETAAHLRDNGRITIMVFAMSGDALIVRLYGRGKMITRDDPSWSEYRGHFPDLPGERQLMLMEVDEVREACGYMVPQYKKVEDRSELTDWADSLGKEGIRAYQNAENVTSIDGLPTGLVEPDEDFG